MISLLPTRWEFARRMQSLSAPAAAGAQLSGGRPVHGQAWRRIAQSPIWARWRWVHLLGWPGIVGAGLLAACPAFYLSAIEPAQARLSEAHQSATSIQERVQLAANGLNRGELSPGEQLAEFYRIFPNEKNLLPWVEKVFAVAQSEGIRLDEGEYRVTRDRVGRLVRFQMTLPVHSSYPQVRNFLNHVHAEIPIASLEHLQFERQKVNDPEVQAKIKLALYVERES